MFASLGLLTSRTTISDNLSVSRSGSCRVPMCSICDAKALDMDARVPHFIDALNRFQPECRIAWRDNGPQLALAMREYQDFCWKVHHPLEVQTR